jgi:AcrR family transcriptional regulator
MRTTKSTETARRSNTRAYRMIKRAELVDQTKRDITAATARLHTTVGPANTTIAGIAEEAGVTRLTVYRHFPDLDVLFEACRAHWRAENPPPDPTVWMGVHTLQPRVTRALLDLYAWYREHAEELYPIYRDLDSSPASSQARTLGEVARLGDLLVQGHIPYGRAGRLTRALARHYVDYRTWRTLAIEQDLRDIDIVTLALSSLVAIIEA